MFSDIISELLKREGLSPLRLASQIGVPKSLVYEWKDGKREPSVENLVKIADRFGVSLEYLTGREELSDGNDDELTVLLRETKGISSEDYDMLVKQFKDSLGAYIKSKRGNNND